MNKNPYIDIIKFAAITTVILVVMIFIILSQFTKISAIDKEIEELNVTYNEKILELQNLMIIRSELPIYEKQLEDFNNMMPEKATESNVSKYLLDAAMKTNIEISSIKYGPIVPKASYSERSVIFGLDSNFNELIYFLDKLQNGKRLVVLDSLDIKQKMGGGKTITTQIEARMFQSTTTGDPNAKKTEDTESGTAGSETAESGTAE